MSAADRYILVLAAGALGAAAGLVAAFAALMSFV